MDGFFSSHTLTIALILVLAVLLAGVGVYLFRKGEDSADATDTEDWKASVFDLPKAFIGKLGFFTIDNISKSFQRAIKTLHRFIGGSNFRYQLPWILVIGPKGAGKTSFIKSLNLDLPIGNPDFLDDDQVFSLVDWNFYNHGILVEADGSLVMDSQNAQSDEEDWRLLLDSFCKYRPKRPLDGIVLTIPYDELIQDGDFDGDDQVIRAEYLYRKLWDVQRVTGLRLPIYIVVTKCDKILGFDNVVKNIPLNSTNGMFGWSNGKSLDVVYRSEWVSEAFAVLKKALYGTQEELYTQGLTQFDRDGVFLFPLSINKIKEGLQGYSDRLFRDSSYHESFFLRGIYFTGSYGDPTPTVLEAPNVTLPADGDDLFSRNLEALSNIAFTTSLIEDKVFREVGLARPVEGILLGNTKALNIAKTGVAVGAIIGTLGLLKSNENLKIANLNLLPALQQIETQLEGLNASEPLNMEQRFYFDSHAQVLLSTMSQIQINSLFSLFVPSSWFSPLDAKIQKVMALAYDQVIFQSLFTELKEKAKNIVSLASSQIGVDTTAMHSQDPMQSPEFVSLQNYVNEITTFEQIAEKFNGLSASSSPSPADVAYIVKYLFNYDLPVMFYKEDEYYAQALLQSQVKPFDFEVFRNPAIAKLQALFETFEDVAFNVDYMVPGLAQLLEDFRSLRESEDLGQFEVSALRNLSKNLNNTLNAINNPDLNWMDSETFDPGESYDELMDNVTNSRYFFGENVSQTLTMDAEKRFVDFKANLASYRSPLVGGTLFETELGNVISTPSLGILKAQGDLNLFFSEIFMVDAKPSKLTTVIPSGTVLLWEATQLQQAVDMIAAYNTFLSTRAMTFPKNLQGIFGYTARQSLAQNLTIAIANAQTLSSTISAVSVMSPEDALLSQVQNYRVTLPLLEQVFAALRLNSANNTYAQLRALVTQQNYALLEKIDQILEDDQPYVVKGGNFSWWDGTYSPSLNAFSVDTLPDLKSYLNLQRERINYLSKEFAEPIVQILAILNKDGMPADLPLVDKWQGIIDAVNGYVRKAPDNSLATLETYIEDTLSEVTLALCPQLTGHIAYSTFTMDYFTSILQGLEISLTKQCENLGDTTSSQTYDQLANYFNANLAGKFPFVDDPQGVAPDAAASDVQGFFSLMDQYGPTVSSALKEAKSLGEKGARASEFMTQMTAIRTFLGAFLLPKDPTATPSFAVKVDFRVNRDREVLGNQILDWSMSIADSKIDFRDTTVRGFWQYGAPVSMTFKWAANSPLEPTGSAQNLAMQVDGNTVSFSYPGQWGLLRLLLSQRATPSDFNHLADNQPTTLKFSIPVAPSANVASALISNAAQVFVRVQVQPLQSAAQEQTVLAGSTNPHQNSQLLNVNNPVPLPAFPTFAPILEGGGF